MKAKRVCRVCGKIYEACDTIRPGDGTFNWRKVACSRECGARYLHDVLAARGQLSAQETSTPEPPEESEAGLQSAQDEAENENT